MTFLELEEKVKEYRRKWRTFECNLFFKELRPGVYCPDRKLGPYCAGLYVVAEDNAWEVYWCEYDRGSSQLKFIFYSEGDLYDFIFCCYKHGFEFEKRLVGGLAYREHTDEQERTQYSGVEMLKSLICVALFIVIAFIVLLGGEIWSAIRGIWPLFVECGFLLITVVACGIGYLYDEWSEYRSEYGLAKKNFEIYKVKKWVEKCVKEIKEGIIPEPGYSFSGEMQEDHIYVEKARVHWEHLKTHHFPNDNTPCYETDAWKVISLSNGEKTMHGIFSDAGWAYVFLFYLVAKKDGNINIERWHWGLDIC